MAISKLFKKSNAPDELPDLAIDELKRELKKDYSKQEEKMEETPKSEEVKEEPVQEEAPTPEETEEVKEEPVQEESQNTEEIEEAPVKNVSKKGVSEENINLEKSFFNPLLNELKKDNFDPSKIDGWYKRTFSDKSAIEGMKEYWQQQKDEFITESIEKEFKKRISEKMLRLQKLEAEWQEIYINLIQKEEEMKKEEMEIKKIIREFAEVIKKKRNVKKESKIR